MDNTDVKPSNAPQTGQANQPSESSVGLAQKEQEPISSLSPELIRPSEPEVEFHEEVKKAGVEAVNQHKVPLTDEHARIGIQHAGESVQVRKQPSVSHQYPISEEEAKENIKTGKKDDSIFGLAMVVLREIGKERI